jgi:Ca2+-binding EF-hand superfamily protein
MLTDYQKTKFDTYFRHLDRDGSGAVEWADFETVVENIRAAKGWSAEEARYQRLVEAQRDYWQKITERVDKDGDGKVSPAEFNAFHESVGRDIEEHGRAPAWAVALVHAYHRMLDTAGNGTIDEDEYGVYLKALGSRVNPGEAFRRLDLDRDGAIDISEMEKLFTQYIISDNPGEPGNYLVTGAVD